MREKNFFSRLKVLSRPSGDIQWKQATRALILMGFAGLIAEFFGLNNGIQTIMFITLLATIIMDISVPLRKVIPLALAGLFMTILAFTSVSLSLGNVYIFVFFTVLWSFFGLSTYIFGESVGYFGFIIFDAYFLAIILVNNSSSTPEWAFYCIISFLIASLLLIPRLWKRKQELGKMVAVGFVPQNSLKEVLITRQALSGVPLPFNQYELFRIGTYLTGFRGYGKILLSRLSGAYQEEFKGFLKMVDGYGSQIAEGIIKGSGHVNLENLDEQFSTIEREAGKSKQSYFLAFVDVAHQMRNLLSKANELMDMKNMEEEKTMREGKEKNNQTYKKISSPQTSLKEVLQANFNLKNMYIRHALRFTLAMTIGLLLVYLTHNRDVIWVTMGILIIIKPDITSTINNMILRVSFNVVAIIFAIILAFIFPHEILLWLAFLMLFFFRAFFPTYMGLSVMALTIFVVLIWPTGTVFDNALARLIDISLGAIIALICAYLILPSRVTVDLPGQVARTIRANQEYIRRVLVDPKSYNHESAIKSLNNYMLEDSNLEADIRKLQDFFTDVSEDISVYQDLVAVNRKLSADVSAVATIWEKENRNVFDVHDIVRTNQILTESLENSASTMKENFDALRDNKSPETLGKISFDLDNCQLKSLEQYLNWIISDVNLIQVTIEKAVETDAIEKYRKLT